jgi:hypothetical protein
LSHLSSTSPLIWEKKYAKEQDKEKNVKEKEERGKVQGKFEEKG